MRVALTPEARIRGDHEQQAPIWSYISEPRIPRDHPLRPDPHPHRRRAEGTVAALPRLYARTGRPSAAPERLLRALLLQVL